MEFCIYLQRIIRQVLRFWDIWAHFGEKWGFGFSLNSMNLLALLWGFLISSKDRRMYAAQSPLGIILYWFVAALAVLITSWIMPGIRTKSFISALIAAIVIAAFNASLWYLLFVLTLPINILTLGLFTFVINGAILKIAAAILPGFEVSSWFSAIIGAIVLSIVQMLLRSLIFGGGF
jgi:putative membrane protein